MKAKVTVSVEMTERNEDVLNLLKTLGYDNLKNLFRNGEIDSANWHFEEEDGFADYCDRT